MQYELSTDLPGDDDEEADEDDEDDDDVVVRAGIADAGRAWLPLGKRPTERSI
jgi:hypothetical protein